MGDEIHLFCADSVETNDMPSRQLQRGDSPTDHVIHISRIINDETPGLSETFVFQRENFPPEFPLILFSPFRAAHGFSPPPDEGNRRKAEILIAIILIELFACLSVKLSARQPMSTYNANNKYFSLLLLR